MPSGPNERTKVVKIEFFSDPAFSEPGFGFGFNHISPLSDSGGGFDVWFSFRVTWMKKSYRSEKKDLLWKDWNRVWRLMVTKRGTVRNEQWRPRTAF